MGSFDQDTVASNSSTRLISIQNTDIGHRTMFFSYLPGKYSISMRCSIHHWRFLSSIVGPYCASSRMTHNIFRAEALTRSFKVRGGSIPKDGMQYLYKVAMAILTHRRPQWAHRLSPHLCGSRLHSFYLTSRCSHSLPKLGVSCFPMMTQRRGDTLCLLLCVGHA
jgi:hypothetical protein